MRTLSRAAFAAAGLLLAACQTVGDAGTTDLYFDFVRVDPETESVTANAWLTVRDGKIARMGFGAPPALNYRARYDMGGLYASPGLIDTHAHVTLGPIAIDVSGPTPMLKSESRDDITAYNAVMLLSYGVTTIRDPGGDAAINVAYRNAVADGALLGPEARVAGQVIDRTSIPILGLVDPITDAASIEKAVEAQAAAGVDFIKLYYSLTDSDLGTAIAAAHAVGKPTIGHLSVSWKKAAELGIDSIVHAMPASLDDLEPQNRDGYLGTRRGGAFELFEWWERADLDGPVMQEMIRTLAERKVHVDLTMIVFRLAFWGDDPAIREEYMSLAHPAMIENWRTTFRFDIGWQTDDYRRAKAVWPKIEKFARMLYEAGVPLTIGTDFANPFVAPGASLVQEMQLHAESGIPTWAVLRMATGDAARLLDMDGATGRISAGLDADLVFTRSDPSQDLATFFEPALVLANGVRLEPQALRERAAAAATK